MVEVTFACLDGSPFPVAFAHPGDEARRWVLDREHAPTAMTPLAEAVGREGRDGGDLAWAECGLRPWSTMREAPRANGYDYVLDEPRPPAERVEAEEGLARLAQDFGGTLGVWERHCLPRVQEACAWLLGAPPDTAFRVLARWRQYAWAHTSVAGVVARRDLAAVAASCEPVVGERAELVAHQLVQGSPSETLLADAALAQIARRSGGAATDADLDGFLATYGRRATSWSIDHPTALERPEQVDAQVRLLRRRPGREPDQVLADAVSRRQELATQLRRALDEADRERFDRRLARLADFVPVREARAHWQLVASGALRQAVLGRGRVLADQGVLASPGEVLYLRPEEYDDPPASAGDAVPARRREHEHWMAVTPPPVIGATSDVPPTESGALRGRPGAPGRATARARVILDLAEAERLEPGDVLVTTMTSPPWTPLFAVAGAVVTDAGDELSHVAIAAREYGIPCVVGTSYATCRIEDGTLVSVDGDAGTVTIPS